MSLSARPATSEDYSFFAELYPLLGNHDPVPPLEQWAQRMLPTAWLYERDGAPVAYCYTQVLEPVGYIRNVMVAQRAQGQRIGTFVMQHQATWLRERGCTRWCLNVIPDNTPAVRLYRAVGLREHHTTWAVRLPWDALERLPSSPATSVRVADPDLDAELEGTFDIVAGLLGQLRPGSHVLMAERGGERVGVLRFDPTFPGVMPLRVRDPAQLRPLLEGARPHARPEHAWVQLVVEGDFALRDALLAAGAQAQLEVVQMQGPIP
jgi:GNAT superfamily N-acetyltransferase